MNSEQPELFDQLLATLPSIRDQHAPTTDLYKLLNRIATTEAEKHFAAGAPAASKLSGPLKNLQFPFHKMGNITSLHLFGLDEMIIFSFYWANRGKYKRVLDLGANIGLHSIAMNKCGYEVRAFEPDPENFKTLVRNLDLNQAKSVEPINAAVSTKSGTMEFVRVLGNLTGNHLAGAKAGSYGDLQTISVRVDEFKPLLKWADFAKIDVEGHEAELVLSTATEDWATCDALLEIGTEANAKVVYDHFKKLGLNLFSQKQNWKQVSTLQEMPFSYRDGSLFVTAKSSMPWG